MRVSVDSIVGSDVFRDDEQLELFQRGAGGVGVRQRYRRVGAHHPQCLDLTASDRLEQLDRLQPLMGDDARRLPEPAHAVNLRRREGHVRGELIGEPADLAPPHRIRLPGQRKWRRTWFADPPRCEVAIDDGIDLVGPLRRLVDALRVHRDHARGISDHLEEVGNIHLGETRGQCGRGNAAGDVARPRQRGLETAGVSFDVVLIERAGIGKLHQ